MALANYTAYYKKRSDSDWDLFAIYSAAMIDSLPKGFKMTFDDPDYMIQESDILNFPDVWSDF